MHKALHGRVLHNEKVYVLIQQLCLQQAKGVLDLNVVHIVFNLVLLSYS